MRIVLYKPDIPQNVGAILRLCACFGYELHIIEPCGFPLDDKRLRRAGMDYIEHVKLIRHGSWETFCVYRAAHTGRILALTTKASVPYTDMTYIKDDYLLMGQEGSGLPEEIHASVDARLIIPMQEGVRSLNVAMSTAIVAAEAKRQIEWSDEDAA